MSIKIHIAAALVAATSAVLILALFVYSQRARDRSENLSSDRQVLTFWHVDRDLAGIGSTVTISSANDSRIDLLRHHSSTL